jgi:type IX secretion system PorP/SprF family membrane protein
MHQRLQWPALDAHYVTTFFSADNFFSKSNSGLGVYFYKDWQGANTVSTSEAALQYSYELHLSRSLSFRAGLQVSYVSRFLNYSYLKFPDQYDDWGYSGATNQPYGSTKVNYLDFSSGGILYSDKIWFGIACNHLNQPDQSYLNTVSSKLPVKLDLTGGYRFDLEERNVKTHGDQGKDVYFTPTFHYKMQGKSDQVDLGVYFLYDHIITGLWYRGIPLLKHYRKNLQNNESAVVQVGWRVNGFTISYSYDITVSKLAVARTGGSHELNLTYIADWPPKKKRVMKRIPCPHFYR